MNIYNKKDVGSREPEDSAPVRVVFEPMGIACRARPGQTLLEAADERKIALRSDCGALGRCGKCRVAAGPPENLGPLTDAERAALTDDQVAAGFRLACQASVLGAVRVAVDRDMLDSEDAIGKTGVQGSFAANPLIERLVLDSADLSLPAEVPAQDLAAHVGACVRQRYRKTLAFRDPDALRGLSRPFAHRGPVTLVNHLRRGVTAVLEGTRPASLGVALDVGTTTLAAYLCDLPTGRMVASAAAANPQRRFGEDVISRIAHADATPEGTETLQRLVIGEINTLLDGCLATAGAGRTDVDEVTVVGNPTMQQIFAGLHPHSLGYSPYLPVCRAPHDLRAADLGLTLNPGTPVHVLPVISGFVGGDTVGVVLADRPHEREEISLLVDIGTNGELVLGNRHMLWATSCATGPALEGAHIDCGMRAAAGAVHRVQIDPATQGTHWEVLGNSAPPQGVCGSGIIDAIAGMRQAGLLLDSGRIREGMPGVETDERGIGRRFVLIPSGKTATGRDIFISLGDVRQIQLAKAALSVGIQLLMRRAGVTRIDRMVLTGAFGARFDWRNAVAIGMLPDSGICGRVEVIENAAGQGAIMALVDRDQRDAALALAERMRFVELAEDPAFAVEFPAATAFPPL